MHCVRVRVLTALARALRAKGGARALAVLIALRMLRSPRGFCVTWCFDDRHGERHRQRHTWAASEELELEMARRRVRYDALPWKRTKWRVWGFFSRLSLFQKAFKTPAGQKQGVTAIDGSDGKNNPNLWS